MAIVMTKVSIEAYIEALQYALGTDERIEASLSRPKELLDTVRDFARNFAKRYADDLEAHLSDHIKIRVAYQDNTPVAGYLVVGGELVGLFSLARGKGDWIMGHAVSDGANHLDCFAEPALLKLYHKHGFTINRSVANWDPTGLPVVYMSR